MSKQLQLHFHADAGHGWLAVKRKLVNDLGIADKITDYSYQRGKTVYLEEDLDAGTFMDAAKAAGYEISFKESHVNYSPIRSYERYEKQAA